MKQILMFSVLISLLGIFWACSSDKGNPVNQQTGRVFDASVSWDSTSARFSTTVRCLAASGSNVYAGTSDSGVYVSTNNGESWTKRITGLGSLFISGLLVKGTNLFAGTNGGVYLSTNNGSNWSLANSGITQNSIEVLAQKDTFIFAGTQNGGFRSSTNGQSWVNMGIPGSSPVRVYSFGVRGTRLFAGTDASIYCSDNNGTSWKEIKTGLSGSRVYSIAIKDGYLFAAMGTYGIFRSSDDSSWTAANGDLFGFFLAGGSVISFLTYDSNILFGAESVRALYLSLNNGENWASAQTGLNLWVRCFAKNDSYVFAGGYYMNAAIGNVWRHPL